MSNKSLKVTSKNQKGGVTAGVININSKNNKKKYPIIVIVMLILAVLTFFGLTGDKMFGKNKTPNEVINVESHNQSGGVTAGKIENLNMITVNNKDDSIQSIFLEAKLTVTKKENTETIPSEVEFNPVGSGSHAYFESNEEKVRLQFQSPVSFLQNDNKDITIINRFALQPGSVLQNKQLDYLSSFNLSVPIVTVVYGNLFDKFKLLEVSLVVNGEEVWKNKWQYDVKFENGPRFSIPLK